MAEMPPSVDVDFFKFKQLRKLKINFDDQSFPDDKVASLLAVSNRFGLVFIGTPASRLLCLRTSDLIEIDRNATPAEKRVEALDFPKREIELTGRPSFVSLSADSLTLMVCLDKSGFPVGCFYDVRAFARQEGPITPFKEVRLSTSEGVTIQDCVWNPAVVELVAVCLSDGSLTVIGVQENNVNINSLPASTNARALSWSPRGKQIAVAKDSAIVQYRPDLTEARSIPFNQQSLGMDGSSRPVPCGILWLSTPQFLTAFNDEDNPEASPKVFVVNVHKTGPATFINYEDICYEVSKQRRHYLMQNLASWNVTLVASATALEIGVLGQSGGTADQPEWTQWYMEDAWRAELPLTASKEDTFPLGVALDTTSQVPIPWGENQQLEPVPILLILSTSGLLCPYHVINLKPGAEKLTHPAEALSASGERKGIEIKEVPQSLKRPTVPLAASTPVPTAPVVERPALPRSNLTDSFAAVAQAAAPPKFAPPPTFAQAAGGFSFAKPTTAPAPVKPMMPASITPVAATPAAPPPAPAPQPAPIAQVAAAPLQQQVAAQSSAASMDESNLLAAVLQGEISKFQKELNEFKTKASAFRGVSAIGSEEEKQRLLKRTADLQNFGKDLVETTRTQNTEIQSLRSETVEVTALLEEARLRHSRRKNSRFHQLLKMRPLDPVSRRRLANVQQLQSYLEQQMQEAFKKLDQMSRDVQRPATAPSGAKRLEIPVTQVIYESVTNNEKTINRLCDKMERMKMKAKEQHAKTVGAVWDALRLPRTSEGGQWDSELAALADSLLSTQLSKPATNGADASGTSPTKPMIPQVSPEKQALLRDALTNRPVARIRSVRPETPGESRLLSNLSSLIQSAASPKSKVSVPEKPTAVVTTAPPTVSPVKSAPAAQVEDITPPSTPINLEQKAKSIGVQPLMSSFALTPQQRASVPSPTTIPAAPSVPAPSTGFALSFGSTGSQSTPSGLASFGTSTKAAASTAASPASRFSLSFGAPTAKPPAAAPTVTTASVASTAATIKPFSTAPTSSIPATSSAPVKSLFAAFSSASATPTPTTLPAVPAAAIVSAAPTPVALTELKFPVASATKSVPAFTVTPTSTAVAATSAPASAATSFSFSLPKTASAPTLSPMTGAPFAAPTTIPATSAPATAAPATAAPATSAPATAAPATSAPATAAPAATAPATTAPATAAPATSALASALSFNVNKTAAGTPSTTSAPTSTSTFSFSVKSVPTTVSAPFSFSLAGTPSAPSASSTSSATIKPVQLFGQVPAATSTPSETTENKTIPATTSAPSGPLGGLLFGVKTTALTPANTTATSTAAAAPLFGQSAATTTSLFGQPIAVAASTSAPSAPLFGQPTATTTSSLFGQPAATTTTGAGTLFGRPATTTAAPLFGQTAATTTTSSSIFGQVPANATASLFGQPVISTATPLFGQAATTTAAPTLPLFGQTTTSAPSAPLFGQPVATAAPTGSLFGKPPTGGATSAVTSAPSAPSAPLFGQPITTAAPSAPLFGAPVATAAPSAPLFGQNSFGQAPTTTTSSFGLFGSSAGGTSTFGGKPAFGSAPVFGQASANTGNTVFGASQAATTAPQASGTPSASTPSGFGGSGMFGGMGLGGTPSSANANRNVFGGGSTFGTSAPASGVFGSPAPSSGFGNAAAGASSPPPSAFGSFGQTQTTAPAFGGAPSFGGSPLFGGKPTFGSGTPTFGSPQATASPQPAGAFGGFAAASNLPSFGVLAGSPTNSQPAFGGAAFPQSPQPSYGSGSSFSSWR